MGAHLGADDGGGVGCYYPYDSWERQRVKIAPLRDLVVVELLPEPESRGKIQVVRGAKHAVRQAAVQAVGPECRDIVVGQTVIINLLVATGLNGQYLVAEPTILGRLP